MQTFGWETIEKEVEFLMVRQPKTAGVFIPSIQDVNRFWTFTGKPLPEIRKAQMISLKRQTGVTLGKKKGFEGEELTRFILDFITKTPDPSAEMVEQYLVDSLTPYI